MCCVAFRSVWGSLSKLTDTFRAICILETFQLENEMGYIDLLSFFYFFVLSGFSSFCNHLTLFQHRFQPQNPLAGAQQFVSRDPQEDDELKLCSHTMTLPTRGQLEGRMIVTAYEHGLDNVTEEAVTIVIHALEASITAVFFKYLTWKAEQL